MFQLGSARIRLFDAVQAVLHDMLLVHTVRCSYLFRRIRFVRLGRFGGCVNNGLHDLLGSSLQEPKRLNSQFQVDFANIPGSLGQIFGGCHVFLVEKYPFGRSPLISERAARFRTAMPGTYQMCWCPASASCKLAFSFRAPAGKLQFVCPAGYYEASSGCAPCGRGFHCD